MQRRGVVEQNIFIWLVLFENSFDFLMPESYLKWLSYVICGFFRGFLAGPPNCSSFHLGTTSSLHWRGLRNGVWSGVELPRAELHPTMPGGLLTQTEEALRPLSYRWVPGADWNSARGPVTCSLDMWEYINLTCMHMIVLSSIWRETSTHSLIKSECSLLMSVDFSKVKENDNHIMVTDIW